MGILPLPYSARIDAINDLIDGFIKLDGGMPQAVTLANIAVSGSASDLTSGTLADARLSSNVALKNASQLFTGGNTFQATQVFEASLCVGIGGTGPRIRQGFLNASTQTFRLNNNADTARAHLEVGDIASTGTGTFSGNISAASATFANVLSLGINQWHTDANGAQRLYYWGADRTIIKGHGSQPIEFRNGSDTTIGYYTNSGGWFFSGSINPGGLNYPVNTWINSSEGSLRAYYATNAGSIYRGYDSTPHQFRNGIDAVLAQILADGRATFASGVSALDISGNSYQSSSVAFSGNGHLALYSGGQIYLGDNNFRNTTYWNSAPGIGAVGGSPTSELAFYVYTGNVNSRTEAGRFKSTLTFQIGGTSGLGLKTDTGRLSVRNSTDTGLGEFWAKEVFANDMLHLFNPVHSGNQWFRMFTSNGITTTDFLKIDSANTGAEWRFLRNGGLTLATSGAQLNMSTGANTFTTFMGGPGNYEGFQHFATNGVTRLLLSNNGIAVQNNIRMIRDVGNVAELSDFSNLSTRVRISGATGQQIDIAGSSTVRLITNETQRLSIDATGMATFANGMISGNDAFGVGVYTPCIRQPGNGSLFIDSLGASGNIQLRTNASAQVGLLVGSLANVQFRNGNWHGSITDGLDRFLFTASGTSYWKGHGSGTAIAHEWRNGSDEGLLFLLANGNFGVRTSTPAARLEVASVNAGSSTRLGFRIDSIRSNSDAEPHIRMVRTGIAGWNLAQPYVNLTLYLDGNSAAPEFEFGQGGFGAKTRITVNRPDGVTGCAVIESPSWDNSYVAIRHANQAQTAATTALQINANGVVGLNASTGQSLSLKIGNTPQLTFDGTFATFATYTISPGLRVQSPLDGPDTVINPGTIAVGGASSQIVIQARDAVTNSDTSILYRNGGLFRIYHNGGDVFTLNNSGDIITNGYVKIGGTGGPLLKVESGAVAFKNSGDTAYTQVRATEYRLDANSFSRVAQLNSATGGWGGGYNFNVNSGTFNRDSTGTVNAVYYNVGAIQWFSEASAAPAVITPRMTLSPTLFSLNNAMEIFGTGAANKFVVYNNATKDYVRFAVNSDTGEARFAGASGDLYIRPYGGATSIIGNYLTVASTYTDISFITNQGGSGTSPLTLRNSSCLFTTGVWHKDSNESERFYYLSAGGTFYKGNGTVPHTFRNGAGNDILYLNSDGTGQLLGHFTSAFQSLSADPSTADLSAGQERLVKNTTSGQIRRFVNDGGTIKKSPEYTI